MCYSHNRKLILSPFIFETLQDILAIYDIEGPSQEGSCTIDVVTAGTHCIHLAP